MDSEDKSPTIVHHLVAQTALAILRYKGTPSGMGGFVQASDDAAMVLASEMTKDVVTTGIRVQTPLGYAAGHQSNTNVVLVPILRAGLALQMPFWRMLPHARIHHVGIARDETTALPHRYYPREPREITHDDLVILLDPMLATGGSACDVLEDIEKYKPREIRFANIIAAPEGIEKVRTEHPRVKIYTLAVDHGLNEKKYIVPGLGDFGDRFFGTV